jgi:hypothetical protein
MRLDAAIEVGQVCERVVRRFHGEVAEQPQERGFLGMLLHDLRNDVRAGRTRRGSGAATFRRTLISLPPSSELRARCDTFTSGRHGSWLGDRRGCQNRRAGTLLPPARPSLWIVDLDSQHHLPSVNAVAVPQYCLIDSLAVHGSAVGAAEIPQKARDSIPGDLAVPAREILVSRRDPGIRVAPDDES